MPPFSSPKIFKKEKIKLSGERFSNSSRKYFYTIVEKALFINIDRTNRQIQKKILHNKL